MTAPANIRINTQVPFPALITGNGPITITKVNGIWTIGFSFTAFGAQNPPLGNYPTDYILVYDSIANTYFKLSLTNLSSLPATINPTIVTTTPYVPVASDTILLMNVAGAAVVNLPLASSRNGGPLMIKDISGLAGNGTNTITVNKNTIDTIDGLTSFVINVNYGGYRIGPISTGWFIMP